MVEKDPKKFTRLFAGAGAEQCREHYGETSPDLSMACEAGRFLEASPMTSDVASFLATLTRTMPLHLLPMARFAVIFREPVAELLAWYNHVRRDITVNRNYKTSLNACYNMSSFGAFATCNGPSNGFTNFEQILRDFDTFLPRSQLLVLSFEHVTGVSGPTATAMQALTSHYGGPVLPDVQVTLSLPSPSP